MGDTQGHIYHIEECRVDMNGGGTLREYHIVGEQSCLYPLGAQTTDSLQHLGEGGCPRVELGAHSVQQGGQIRGRARLQTRGDRTGEEFKICVKNLRIFFFFNLKKENEEKNLGSERRII